ncbi:gliding motility-associated C-terminal domain-containing protein, partial [bacterium]|nr:gliding motility-associated C-terminal domain-containing protein [bacterium]
ANWGSSVSPEGSTPGRRNSIHVAELPTAGRLTISPNPFTPDGDGIDDRCVIRFDLPMAQATVRLTIFDVMGRVRVVLRDHDLTASTSEQIWDGRDADGSLLPAGICVACLEAISARAGLFVTAKTAVGLVR